MYVSKLIGKIHMIKRKLTQRLKIKRFENGENKTIFDTVAIEQESILKIGARKVFHFLCTPDNLQALVIGFLFTQGMITNAAAIKKIKLSQNIVVVELHHKTSRLTIANNQQINPVQPEPALVFKVMRALQQKQKIFPLTGGSHAALIFDIHGKILSFAEDVARHNAIDKAIGKCLLNKKLSRAYGIALSSRVTFELVKKIARAKIKLIACVSAPSSLAIQTAKDCRITLCGFVRGERMNVY